MQNGKLYIAEALLSLMQYKSLQNISIKELVKKAGVSRMTYYRYFSSKEEILGCYLGHILSEYEKQVDKSHPTSFHSYEHVLSSLLFFQKYKTFALCLRDAGMESILLDALNDYVKKQSGFSYQKPVRAYSYYFYAGALFNVYMQWILEDTITPATELASIISKINLL